MDQQAAGSAAIEERSTYVQNGNGHGIGKRWLLIGLLILIGFWFANDAYDDGYRDALVSTGQTGQAANFRGYRGGPHFPWGLVIVGGIAYIAYRKGAFDRLGGPGGPFGGGGRYVQGHGEGPNGGYPPARPEDPGFRGPRAFFDEWHRQAHEEMRSHMPMHQAPPAPAGTQYAHAGNGAGAAQAAQTPPPPPPAPDYWASMARAASGAEQADAGTTTAAPDSEQVNGPQGATGPALERW
jgi:hypothetical protein